MTTGQSGHDHSLAIRQEIQRFESVHPSIYAIYDLIELVPDAHIAKQIREHVVAIEGILNDLIFFIYFSGRYDNCCSCNIYVFMYNKQ